MSFAPNFNNNNSAATMCRFIVYKGRGVGQEILLGDLVVRPSHSIIKQSFGCKERTVAGASAPQLNADGFGKQQH